MHQNTRGWRPFAGVLAAFMLIAACNGASPTQTSVAGTPPAATAGATAAPTGTPGPAATGTPVAATAAPTPNVTPETSAPPGQTLVRWFVGLGTGANPDQIPVEQAAVQAFNAGPGAEHHIYLSIEIYQNAVAYDTLTNQIANHVAPDIIGPIGVRALNGFGDQLLDLSSYVAAGTLDTTGVEQNLIDLYNVGGKQIGVPYAVYPSMMYYNKAAFKEAGIEEPPHKVGDKYTMPDGSSVDWNWDTVAAIAKLLTVDNKGNDSTSPDFNPAKVDTWGFDFWFTDPRGWASGIGGSGSVVADDGKTAQMPDNWKKAFEWYHKNVWVDHVSPDQAAINAYNNGGNTFGTGKVAMGISHTWYQCCITGVADWDVAVAPIAFDGKVTAKLHSDTMGILASSANPDAAVEAMNFIMSRPEIAVAYGAMPAKAADRPAFFEALDAKFAAVNPDTNQPLNATKVDWQVASDMLGYTEFPNHEADMPNFLKSDAAIKAFGTDLLTNADPPIDDRIAALVQTLQGDFDETP
ncbi:MAG: multiple sugar transport system substrate-binding protein [Chloroflexota bacterium]|jgi:multiple sugar transport system substrate-binding protein|nr:multiple sugar transport system substrate-binding protein [Chloroflexota bacterium]